MYLWQTSFCLKNYIDNIENDHLCKFHNHVRQKKIFRLHRSITTCMEHRERYIVYVPVAISFWSQHHDVIWRPSNTMMCRPQQKFICGHHINELSGGRKIIVFDDARYYCRCCSECLIISVYNLFQTGLVLAKTF